MNKVKQRPMNPKDLTILIIDDEPANLAVVVSYLVEHGFQVKVAQNGETGLALAQQAPPDLILLDVMLPGINGFETCHRLKADERTQEIPVIFMTIITKIEDKVRGFEAGGVDYITKPFQHKEVLARVTTQLRLRQLTRTLQAQNEQLQRAQKALFQANIGLEQRVAERTAELAQANTILQEQIAERHRVEADLTAERNLLRTLIDNLPDFIYVKDTESRFVLTNHSHLQHLGVSTLDEILGKTDFDFYPPDLAQEFYADEQMVLRSGQPLLNKEEHNQRKDAHDLRWTLTTKVPRQDSQGQIIGLVGISHDITERKRVEAEIRRLNQELEQRVTDRTAQLKAINKELEAFAYSVSHDLRAPLRHIDGFLELLQQRTTGSLDERSQHYMVTVSDAARRMGQLIDDLLAFSRMGRDELVKTPIELDALVQEAIRELAPEMQGRTIHWHITDLPTVTGDQAMLRQALVNLLSNALKFTRRCASAEIEIGYQIDEKETIIFIRDNGVGFDMAYADKLFGVFQRLHPADEFEGTGIGLANVSRIIQRHNGRTWADGETDHGATFYFSLPHPVHEA